MKYVPLIIAVFLLFQGCAMQDIATHQDVDFVRAEVSSDMRTMTGRVTALESRMNDVSSRLDLIASKVGDIKSSVYTEVSGSFEQLQAEMHKELKQLEKDIENARKLAEELKKKNALQQKKIDVLVDETSKQFNAISETITKQAVASDSAVSDMPIIYHTVEFGETLSSIASKYGVSSQMIIAINKIKNPNTIKAGTKLAIPAPE